MSAVRQQPLGQTAAGLAESIAQRLACPVCHRTLTVADGTISCATPGCAFKGGQARDGVAIFEDPGNVSFFDATHQMVETSVHDSPQMFYTRQSTYIEQVLGTGRTVLDVGCGPVLPYNAPEGCFVIGLDLSYESVMRNADADLRLYASATALPLPDHSVDTILCLYALHHMTGQTVAQTTHNVRTAFGEFARVLRPGGNLLVCEVTPWAPVWVLQRAVWNIGRRLVGSGLDMFFWRSRALGSLGEAALPGARLMTRRYSISPFFLFPPIFSRPALVIPRLLYPFAVRLFHWQLPDAP